MIDANVIIEYTQDDFLAGIQSIVDQIRTTDFVPDYIVGIVRGGCIPAVYLSHNMSLPVVMVHWSARDNHLVSGNESNCWIPEDLLEGKKILLVDDIVDGGDTIRELLADWNSSIRKDLPLENIRIASLWYNVDQDVKVDFCHKAISRKEDPRWIVFPWEY